MNIAKAWEELSALAKLFYRAFFISPFNRRDHAMMNLLIISKKGPEFNIHALLEYDYALNEEITKLRSRMGERTENFQDELKLASSRIDELFAKAGTEALDAQSLSQVKREMDIELKHMRSEWEKWQNLIEDELHSQRDIGGKIRTAWYALTPKDPDHYGDATEVVAAVIKEREKLKTGWKDLAREQEAFFEKVKDYSEKHVEIDEAWKAISYAQRSIKEERDRLKESWNSLKSEQESIIARFSEVEKGYQQIDEAWKEISYTQKTLGRAKKELGELDQVVSAKVPRPVAPEKMGLKLQEENLKRDQFEKEASRYMGDIKASLKETRKAPGEVDSVNEVLEQIIDVTSKSTLSLTGEHPFKLPKRDGDGVLATFYYQNNIYDFWRWFRDHSEEEVLVIGPSNLDPLWERTLDFLAGKGASLAHFDCNVSLIKRKMP